MQKHIIIILIEAHWIECKINAYIPSKSYKSNSVRAYKLKLRLQ